MEFDKNNMKEANTAEQYISQPQRYQN